MCLVWDNHIGKRQGDNTNIEGPLPMAYNSNFSTNGKNKVRFIYLKLLFVYSDV